MKKYKLILLTNLIIFFSSCVLLAQHDYQTVQSFKYRYNKIQQNIKNADSLVQLEQVPNQIEKLKLDFIANKKLLDRSLYPEKFLSSILKLQNNLQVRIRDLVEIFSLKSNLYTLRVKVDSINSKNNVLFSRLELLNIQISKDSVTIASLRKNVSSLMASLSKRDVLIMNMLVKLTPSEINGKILSVKKETQSMYSEKGKIDIASYIESAVGDNIKFLRLTTLTSEDLNTIKRQKDIFISLWNKLEPELIPIYYNKKAGSRKIAGISFSFDRWQNAMNHAAWRSIKKEFTGYNINLNKFSNGNQFTTAVTNYIRDKVKNAILYGGKIKNIYKTFSDSVWYGEVKPKWQAYLTGNKMLTSGQIRIIDTEISLWKNDIYPGNKIYYYLAAGVILFISGLILLLKKFRKHNKSINKENSSVYLNTGL